MNSREQQLAALGRLLDIMDELRLKCPWDRKQTFDSLRANTIEEAFELADAIERHCYDDIREELGDLLLHIVFYSKMGAEQGSFDIGDVAQAISEKMIRRHPHIYGQAHADTPDQVADNWEKIKQKEHDGHTTVLGGVPAGLPSMIKAYRVQDKARHVGFDWDKPEDVWAKVKEETAEVEQAIASGRASDIEEEFGDLIFSIINAARLHHVNPDNALERTNRKFISRFNHVEQRLREEGLTFSQTTLARMDELWNEAKQQEQ